MKTKMFAVYDLKAACYGTPFFMPREEVAVRTFSDSVNDSNPNNLWNKHPEDYSLFYIGEYDDESCEVTCSKPSFILSAASVRAMRHPGFPGEVLDTVPQNGKVLEGVR